MRKLIRKFASARRRQAGKSREGQDADAGEAAAFADGLDDNLDAPVEGIEKAEQAVGGEPFELAAEQRGDFGLVDAEQLGRRLLREFARRRAFGGRIECPPFQRLPTVAGAGPGSRFRVARDRAVGVRSGMTWIVLFARFGAPKAFGRVALNTAVDTAQTS
jgi:hypothetical protein